MELIFRGDFNAVMDGSPEHISFIQCFICRFTVYILYLFYVIIHIVDFENLANAWISSKLSH